MRKQVLSLILCIALLLFMVPAFAATYNIVRPAEGDYYIVPEGNSGYALDVAGGGDAREGTVIQLYQKNNSDAQIFTVKHVEGDWYLLVHKRTGFVINVQGGNPNNAARLWLYHNDGTASCQWRFAGARNNSYIIQSKLQRCIDLDNNRLFNGSIVHLWDLHDGQSERWRLVPASSAPARVNHDPQGKLESCQPVQSNAFRVIGYAYDEDNMNHKVRIHVYIDGTAGQSNVPSVEIRADKSTHNGHGFDNTITQVPSQWCGRRTIRLYALNDVGSGTYKEIGSQVIDIPDSMQQQSKTGWIRTNGARLNMRSGPSSSYGIIAKLTNGTQVTVLETRSDGWSKVNTPSGIGYVSSQYVKFDQPAPQNDNAVTQRMQYLSQNTDGYKVNSKYNGSGQCRGFANRVYTTLFNVSSITGYANKNYAASSVSGSREIGRLYDFASNAAGQVQSLFQNAKPGSFIQMGRRYRKNSSGTAPGPHTAILYRVRNDGCEFYEANADGKNTIKINFYSWASLADKNCGFTVYEPNNYALK